MLQTIDCLLSHQHILTSCFLEKNFLSNFNEKFQFIRPANSFLPEKLHRLTSPKSLALPCKLIALLWFFPYCRRWQRAYESGGLRLAALQEVLQSPGGCSAFLQRAVEPESIEGRRRTGTERKPKSAADALAAALSQVFRTIGQRQHGAPEGAEPATVRDSHKLADRPRTRKWQRSLLCFSD